MHPYINKAVYIQEDKSGYIMYCWLCGMVLLCAVVVVLCVMFSAVPVPVCCALSLSSGHACGSLLTYTKRAIHIVYHIMLKSWKTPVVADSQRSRGNTLISPCKSKPFCPVNAPDMSPHNRKASRPRPGRSAPRHPTSSVVSVLHHVQRSVPGHCETL